MNLFYHQLQARLKKIPMRRIGIACYGLSYFHFFFWPLFYIFISQIPWPDGITLESFLWSFLFVLVYAHYRIKLNSWVRFGIFVLKWKRSLYA